MARNNGRRERKQHLHTSAQFKEESENHVLYP